jgi:hypothetical protein
MESRRQEEQNKLNHPNIGMGKITIESLAKWTFWFMSRPNMTKFVGLL